MSFTIQNNKILSQEYVKGQTKELALRIQSAWVNNGITRLDC